MVDFFGSLRNMVERRLEVQDGQILFNIYQKFCLNIRGIDIVSEDGVGRIVREGLLGSCEGSLRNKIYDS